MFVAYIFNLATNNNHTSCSMKIVPFSIFKLKASIKLKLKWFSVRRTMIKSTIEVWAKIKVV